MSPLIPLSGIGRISKSWRTVDERAQKVAVEDGPRVGGEEADAASMMSRRTVLKSMAASAAVAALSGCKRHEKIVPFVHNPPRMTAGNAEFFATVLTRNGSGRGVLVESHEGRPTKIEGNPKHPDSFGACDGITSAQILSLYDSDRSQSVVHHGTQASWLEFTEFLKAESSAWSADSGASIRIVTPRLTSPSELRQLEILRTRYPAARWHTYETFDGSARRDVSFNAFGNADALPVFNFENARVIVSIGSDFLSGEPGALAYARSFALRRAKPLTFLCAESDFTVTGANADERIPVSPSELRYVCYRIAMNVGALKKLELVSNAELDPFCAKAAKLLQSAKGECIFAVGREEQGECHALAALINEALGNRGRTVSYLEATEDKSADFDALTADIESKAVRTVILLGVNPAYSLGEKFEVLLNTVEHSIHLGRYVDETGALCEWHVPQTHELEEWGDARAFNGVVSIRQPLIAPLFNGASLLQLLALLNDSTMHDGYDLVRSCWNEQRPALSDLAWNRWVYDGVIEGTSFETIKKPMDSQKLLAYLARFESEPSNAIAIVLRPDPTVGQGDDANNNWLQELPKPLSKLTWDNALLIAPETAHDLGVETGDIVRARARTQELEAPVFVLPGMPKRCAVLHTGYGRRAGGRFASQRGVNAFLLRTHSNENSIAEVSISRTGKTYALATTQTHFSMEGRDPVGADAEEHRPVNESLYPSYDYSKGPQWGMTIDLNACIGCSACVTACQSENNIPTVGKEEVLRGREMHWIRVDRYFEGALAHPDTKFQPVPCMHCENAPCELVCPVEATVHSEDGLNQMVYNRCVGTRYCSNNCPYKVRRFNFFHYTDEITPLLAMLQNPNVSVRSRGVMEKCTYCVQRIEEGRIRAGREHRPIKDGEIKTACQQACPASAIVFGDITDAHSAVSVAKQSERNFGLLTELGTRPRTTYLRRAKAGASDSNNEEPGNA